GVSAPIAKLEVMNPGKSAIQISSTNYTDTARIVLSNRTLFGAGTDFIVSSNQETGLNISSASDLPSNTNSSILFLNPQGNVGVGNNNPLNQLDVAGSMNVTGALKIGGNPGLNGQMLVSNGAGSPSWQNSALSNNTRFSAGMVYGSGGGSPTYNTFYNQAPADITIGTNTITINRAGLYHFEGFITALAYMGSTPAILPRLALSFYFNPSMGYSLMYGSLNTQFSAVDFVKAEKFSIDLNMAAGSTFTIYLSFSCCPVSTSTEGWLNGYLISQ
ncbi:MAG TPA: hypothetical protein VK498_04045, partial [Ferruginibacter sp.]|nr:hypothetical protein [Ferruginibacter sp.]